MAFSIDICAYVSLEDILNARENRQAKQHKLTAEYSKPLISFTLNIPGPFKLFKLAEQTFNEGTFEIIKQLNKTEHNICHYEVTHLPTGSEGFFLVSGDAQSIKQIMAKVEETHPLGRLFDIDVFTEKNVSVKLAARKERTCFICGGPVWQCASKRTHTAKELFNSVYVVMEQYFKDYACIRAYDEEEDVKIANAALRAILYELGVSPKPGLVDRYGRGAHKDMDFFTFLDSAVSLSVYFKQFAKAGRSFNSKAEKLIDILKPIGIRAEKAMLNSTNGVNVHKGTIFSLGIACGAVGYLQGHRVEITAKSISNACAEIAGSLADEMDTADEKTYGISAYKRYDIKGARGEAAAGFPNVFTYGYPLLSSLLAKGYSCNDAGVATLLSLMANVSDTNIIGRSNLSELKELKQLLLKSLENVNDNEDYLKYAKWLDKYMVDKNLSPGGSADLLALSFFVYFILLKE